VCRATVYAEQYKTVLSFIDGNTIVEPMEVDVSKPEEREEKEVPNQTVLSDSGSESIKTPSISKIAARLFI